MKFIFACLALLLTSCSSQLVPGDLVGKYTMSNGTGIEAIELRRDGVYVHRYTAKDGSSRQQQGAWGLEALQAGQTVVLNNFCPLLGGAVEGRGIYLLLVQQSFGHVSLVTNIDLGTGYEKQP